MDLKQPVSSCKDDAEEKEAKEVVGDSEYARNFVASLLRSGASTDDLGLQPLSLESFVASIEDKDMTESQQVYNRLLFDLANEEISRRRVAVQDMERDAMDGDPCRPAAALRTRWRRAPCSLRDAVASRMRKRGAGPKVEDEVRSVAAVVSAPQFCWPGSETIIFAPRYRAAPLSSRSLTTWSSQRSLRVCRRSGPTLKRG